MTYELLIRESQPPCGGKDPTKTTIKTVTTDDPVAYVKALEPDGKLQVGHAEDGTLVIGTVRNGWTVTYEFTED